LALNNTENNRNKAKNQTSLLGLALPIYHILGIFFLRLPWLPKKILKYLNQNEDQLRFYPLSAHCRHNVVVLGVQPEFVVDDTAFIV